MQHEEPEQRNAVPAAVQREEPERRNVVPAAVRHGEPEQRNAVLAVQHEVQELRDAERRRPSVFQAALVPQFPPRRLIDLPRQPLL